VVSAVSACLCGLPDPLMVSEARAQGEVRTLNLLHQQLSRRLWLGQETSLIDDRFVRVVTSDAKGCEQDLEFQEHRILAGIHHKGQYSPGVMIDRMPEPPRVLLAADKRPHFVQLHFLNLVDHHSGWRLIACSP